MKLSTLTFATVTCVTLLDPALSFTLRSPIDTASSSNARKSHLLAVEVQQEAFAPILDLVPLEEEEDDDPNPMASCEEPVAIPQKKPPSLQAWRRRLVTKEDKFSMHKIANAGFVVSSTVLLAGMLLPNDQGQFFADIPAWLEPFDSLFTLSTAVQGMAAIPMVLKHRKVDPEVGKTQIEMGLQSILLALYSTWESPFCSAFLEEHWKVIFCSLIMAISWLDYGVIFFDSDKIQSRMTKIGVEEAQGLMGKARHFFCFKGQFAFGTAANLVLLANLASTAHDRLDWLQMIEHGYGLPFCSGAEIPLVYFSTILASTVLSYQSLVATLSNKKLIPADTATSIITGGGGIIAFALVQLLFARSMYG